MHVQRLYAVLANLFAAAGSKITERMWAIDRALALVDDHMPSGSGVDRGTKLDVEKSSSDRLIFYVDFHHMDDHGSYDGWTEHTVFVTPSLTDGIKVRVTGINRNDIKDLIHTMVYDALQTEVPFMGYTADGAVRAAVRGESADTLEADERSADQKYEDMMEQAADAAMKTFVFFSPEHFAAAQRWWDGLEPFMRDALWTWIPLEGTPNDDAVSIAFIFYSAYIDHFTVSMVDYVGKNPAHLDDARKRYEAEQSAAVTE